MDGLNCVNQKYGHNFLTPGTKQCTICKSSVCEECLLEDDTGISWGDCYIWENTNKCDSCKRIGCDKCIQRCMYSHEEVEHKSLTLCVDCSVDIIYKSKCPIHIDFICFRTDHRDMHICNMKYPCGQCAKNYNDAIGDAFVPRY